MKNSRHFLFRLPRPLFNLPQVSEDKYSTALADRPLVETAFWQVAGEEWGENEIDGSRKSEKKMATVFHAVMIV